MTTKPSDIPVINPKVLDYDSNIPRRLLRFLGPYRLRMVFAVALMFTSVLDAVFGPAIIGKAVDDGLANGKLALMTSLVLVYISITLISQTSSKFQIATMVRLGETVIREIRQVLYQHIEDLSIGFFARYEVGRLISRIIGDVQMMREFLIFSVLAITRDLVIVIGIIIVMLTTSLPLTVVILLVMPVLFFFALRWSAKSRQVYTTVREEVSSVNARLAEDFNGVRVAQAFAREEFNYNRFHENDNKDVLKINLDAAFVLASFFPLLELMSGLTLFGLVLVEFADVSFAYDRTHMVLHHINLCVEPGQRVAFVGDTGAGKSSMIKLLLRFYDVTEGAVKIDGYDLRDITQHSLRAQMGIVLQETHLFTETIMNNIRSGRDSATDEEVIAAARAVGADSFIMQLPEGYQTQIHKGASILSVGQRQLLAIARALTADPPILILDEATSNIDAHTEKMIR